MASIRERVRSTGVIRDSQGNEVATCVVEADKVTLRGTDAVAYARSRVVSVSQPLPDGVYSITANGTTEQVRHVGGNWLAAMPG
jgi:hypothetical protein